MALTKTKRAAIRLPCGDERLRHSPLFLGPAGKGRAFPEYSQYREQSYYFVVEGDGKKLLSPVRNVVFCS